MRNAKPTCDANGLCTSTARLAERASSLQFRKLATRRRSSFGSGTLGRMSGRRFDDGHMDVVMNWRKEPVP